MVLIILWSSFYFLNLENKKHFYNPEIKKESKEAKKLESFFQNRDDYDSAFAQVKNSEKIDNVVAGITSHHFLAKNLIAQFYSGISNNNIENIILVGPDHYNALVNVDAITTKLNWSTPYGEIGSSEELIEKILNDNDDVTIDDGVFKIEHSIYVEIPFIKKVFPQVKVIPLVLKNNYDYDEFIKIGENLNKLSKDKTLLIISSDFSHDVSVEEARNNDEKSLAVLQNLRVENINDINCDCRACLAVALGFMGEGKKFQLVENKNSADFGSSTETVTSYVSGYFLFN